MALPKKKLYHSSDDFVNNVTTGLRRSGDYSDVTIKLPDSNVSFKLHKLLLAVNSDFFMALFTRAEPGKEEYCIQGLTKEGFDGILDWIYKHQLKKGTVDAMMTIMEQSNYLGCHEVLEEYSDAVMNDLHVGNVVSFERFAYAYQILPLQARCWRFLMFNFRKIWNKDEWLHIEIDDLHRYLHSDDLNVSEEVVWLAAKRWLEHDNTRCVELPSILRQIRFGQIQEQYFENKVLTQATFFMTNLGTEVNQEMRSLFGEVRQYFDVLRTIELQDEPIASPAFAWPRRTQEILFLAGGWTNGRPCNIIETFDFRADRWTVHDVQDPLGERGYLGTAAIGGKIYLIGGTNGEHQCNTVSCFDIESRKFSIVGPMTEVRCYICVCTADGVIYAVGGYDGQKRLNTIEKYDPESNQWTLYEKQMKYQRSDAACVAAGGKIYVAGGFNGLTQLDSVECFDLKSRSWTVMPSMNQKRSGLSCVVVDGEMYALGGFDGTYRLKSCEKFNLAKGKRWIPIPDMKTQRSNFAAEVIDGLILVIGGYNGTKTIPHVETYDPTQVSWVASSDIRVERSALSACLVSAMDLGPETVKAFSYKNRHALAEEKRLFSRQGQGDDGRSTPVLDSEMETMDIEEIDLMDSSDEDSGLSSSVIDEGSEDDL